jgi:hypothetical protein
MKSRVTDVARALLDRVASRIETRLTSTFALDPRTAPATKIGHPVSQSLGARPASIWVR